MSQAVRHAVKDSQGIEFEPGALPHEYTYDASDNMLTDTCFEQSAVVRQKTFTYQVSPNGVWRKVTESAWIVVSGTWRG